MTIDVFEMRRRVREDDIANLVERFYARVRDDPDLGPVFAARIEAQAWPAHLARMRAFWSTILLGTGRYRGNPMIAHASVPGIGSSHFERWLELFGEVLRELFSEEVAVAILGRARRMGAQLTSSLGR